MSTQQQKGFTLIELLVVVAIIGLLASVVLASLSTARKKGRDARRIADMKEIQISGGDQPDRHCHRIDRTCSGLHLFAL